MNPQNKTFEESMARLEQIVRAMERGDVALEESLKLFQEGTELVRSCQKLLDDARALQDAGAFALVLECVPAALAARITKELVIPVIGIGAGAECDGQVLVWQDMTGLNTRPLPRFVKYFGSVDKALRDAIEAYTREVRAGAFPGEEHCYPLPEGMEKAVKKLK